MYEKLLLLRNHGLIDRDTVGICGYNSRLDTFQAVVGNWLLPKAKQISSQRIKNAKYLDKNLSKIKEVTIPTRPKNYRIVYHLYIVFVENRDELYQYCLRHKIEAKIHYPIPIYRQKAYKFLGHKKGDFSVTDSHAKKIISFPSTAIYFVRQFSGNQKIEMLSFSKIFKKKYFDLFNKEYLKQNKIYLFLKKII
jgi:dTDP-4-amino-4,6-dideoxygalactose transaminase